MVDRALPLDAGTVHDGSTDLSHSESFQSFLLDPGLRLETQTGTPEKTPASSGHSPPGYICDGDVCRPINSDLPGFIPKDNLAGEDGFIQLPSLFSDKETPQLQVLADLDPMPDKNSSGDSQGANTYAPALSGKSNLDLLGKYLGNDILDIPSLTTAHSSRRSADGVIEYPAHASGSGPGTTAWQEKVSVKFDRLSTASVSLDDGTYHRDDRGRVTQTDAGDNTSASNKFEYGDQARPDRVTRATIDGVTYKRLAPITSSGKPVEKDGREMASWTMYDSAGKITGHFSGTFEMSPDGVLTKVDYNSNQPVVEYFGAGGQKLSAEEAQKRNQEGIWPGTVDVMRPDGSSIHADLKGKTVESVKETRNNSGKTEQVNWTRKGDTYISDQNPPEERKNVRVEENGDFSYDLKDGTHIVEHKDSTSDVTINGVTSSFDCTGRLAGVGSELGHRSVEYKTDASGQPRVESIETRSGQPEKSHKWKRDNNSNIWVSSEGARVSDLTLKADGRLEYTNAGGNKVIEDLDRTITEYDAQNRPLNKQFAGGARRDFTYDARGLKSFRDYAPRDDAAGDYQTDWVRDGNGKDFISTRDNGKQYTRRDVSVDASGDIDYLGSDNKRHISKADDLDRIASGEFIMTAESITEARDRLTTSATQAGIDMKRFGGWMREFEERSVKEKLDPEKVVRAMDNLSDILQTNNSPHFDEQQRKTIVETGMHNLARPLEIDQGSHPTCNVTSTEVYAAVKHPDQYARLLKEVTATGSWTGTDGKTATPPAAALKPGKDESSYDLDKPDSGKRNLASQVVQMTLINAMYETGKMNDTDAQGNVKVDRSDIRYILGPNRTQTMIQNGQRITIDQGEDQLVQNGTQVKGKNGQPVDGPEMIQDKVIESCKMFFDEVSPHIENSGYSDHTGRREYFNDLPDKQRLLDMKAKGELPILTPTMGGMHAQTIHDVWEDPKTGQLWVLLDNQHGEPEVKGSERRSGEGDGDGWITLDTLHRTLKMPGQGSGFGQPVMPQIKKYDHPSKH